jgi:imidazoleglycerol-phosphate dehydratase
MTTNSKNNGAIERKSAINRKTKETSINITLNIDGSGNSKIDTKINFLNHLLTSFSKHGLFDLEITANGDLKNGQHHLIEDTGIALGQAFDKALSQRKHINRAGYFVFPMDESLSFAAIDISGRPFIDFDCKLQKEKIGDLEPQLIQDFLQGFASTIKASIHIRLIKGRDEHHKAESLFKAFGKAMQSACIINPRIKNTQSTKGRI